MEKKKVQGLFSGISGGWPRCFQDGQIGFGRHVHDCLLDIDPGNVGDPQVSEVFFILLQAFPNDAVGLGIYPTAIILVWWVSSKGLPVMARGKSWINDGRRLSMVPME